MASVILVPQGAEHRAVCQGLKQCSHPPTVISIPIGVPAVLRDLEPMSIRDPVLVMGLCGSLSPQYSTGTIALYQSCIDFSGTALNCDRNLTQRLQEQLGVSPIRGLTSDRVICSAAEKHELGKTYAAEAVDMEGFAVLSKLTVPVAILRVVSDDLQHDLPDLAGAIDADGNLHAGRMAIELIKSPIAAMRLIRGSLVGLRGLRDIAARLDFSSIAEPR